VGVCVVSVCVCACVSGVRIGDVSFYVCVRVFMCCFVCVFVFSAVLYVCVCVQVWVSTFLQSQHISI
jgi:hypothetical protein